MVHTKLQVTHHSTYRQTQKKQILQCCQLSNLFGLSTLLVKTKTKNKNKKKKKKEKKIKKNYNPKKQKKNFICFKKYYIVINF